jgi:hypothetical protein
VSELNTPEPAQAGFALRLFWTLLGHAIVFLSLGVIFVNEVTFPSLLDGLVWTTVVLMIVARRIDVVWCHGTTVIGEPATLAHWRSYTVHLFWIDAAASEIAHTLGR